jgi:formylglycine-generating enzyme required for sulfatase activity
MIFDEGPDHPVGAVNWSAAKTFCDWLTNKERATGTIPSGAVYRLPKESEWLRAAADELENPNPDHPPGNFADEAFHRQTPGQAWIHGFDDGFPATSPVGSFPANRLGIHDLLGNVWEWCDEYYDPSVGGNRLLRGGACSEVGFGRHGTGHVVDGDVGFRIVLELPRH